MGHAPENTIESFAKALELGCDEVETDVWLAEDGRLVISHDRPTKQATLLLDKVLDFCRGRMGVNVELKCELSESRARETGATVARHVARRADPDVYLSSFWWPALDAARAAAPQVRRALLYSGAPDRAPLIAGARAAALWALHPNRSYVTPELIADAHAAGLRVNVWTVDDPKEIETFVRWGVDAIFSNYPERVPR